MNTPIQLQIKLHQSGTINFYTIDSHEKIQQLTLSQKEEESLFHSPKSNQPNELIKECLSDLLQHPDQFNYFPVINSNGNKMSKSTEIILQNYFEKFIYKIQEEHSIETIVIQIELKNHEQNKMKKVKQELRDRFADILISIISVNMSFQFVEKIENEEGNEMNNPIEIEDSETIEDDILQMSERKEIEAVNYQIDQIKFITSIQIKEEEIESELSTEEVEIRPVIKTKRNQKYQEYIDEEEIEQEYDEKQKQIQMIIEDDLFTSEENNSSLNRLNPQCIYIASKYFQRIKDFQNVEMVSKKFRGTIDRFSYNPISVNQKTIHLFTHLKQLHIYREKDEIIQLDQIEKYVVWYAVRSVESKRKSDQIGKPIDFKYVVYAKEDQNNDYMKEFQRYKRIMKKSNVFNSGALFLKYKIPDNVHEIEEECFKNHIAIKAVDLSTSLKTIGYKCFYGCPNLKAVTMYSRMTTFENNWFGKCGKLSKIILPNSITSFPERAFANYTALKQILLPSKITSLPPRCFAYCSSLTKLEGLDQIQSIGIECFKDCHKELNIPKYLIDREEDIPEILNEKQKELIEKWSNMKFDEIIFDSNVDDWSIGTSVFDKKLLNRSNVVIVIEDNSGEKFGSFIAINIRHRLDPSKTDNDTKTFLFNIESNGRLENPLQFPILESRSQCVLHKKDKDILMTLGYHGQIKLYKKNLKEKSECQQYNNAYDYYGIPNALCGKSSRLCFTPVNIVVYQMKKNSK